MKKRSSRAFNRRPTRQYGARRKAVYSRRFKRNTYRARPGNRSFQRRVQDVIEQKLTASNFFTASATGQLTTAQSTQKIFVSPQMMDPNVLSSIAANIDNSRTTQFMIRNYNVEYRLTNSTNVGKIWLTVYRCIARKDVPLDGTSGSQFNSLSTMAVSGFLDANTGLGSTAAPMVSTGVGLSLFANPLWTQFFKIKKVQKVCLLPGQIFADNHIFKGPKKWNRLDFQDNNSNIQYLCLKGFGVTVFAMHGTPVESTATETNTGWGACNINAEQFVRTVYTWVDDRTTASGYTQTNQTFSDPQEVNVMTGLEAPVST